MDALPSNIYIQPKPFKPELSHWDKYLVIGGVAAAICAIVTLSTMSPFLKGAPTPAGQLFSHKANFITNVVITGVFATGTIAYAVYLRYNPHYKYGENDKKLLEIQSKLRKVIDPEFLNKEEQAIKECIEVIDLHLTSLLTNINELRKDDKKLNINEFKTRIEKSEDIDFTKIMLESDLNPKYRKEAVAFFLEEFRILVAFRNELKAKLPA